MSDELKERKSPSLAELAIDLEESADDLIAMSKNPNPSVLSIRNCASLLKSMSSWLNRHIENESASQWIDVKERLPEDGDEVICCYVGVYGPRIVNFWRDAGLNPHFGEPRNRYGSQPATHWLPIHLPLPPNPTKEGGEVNPVTELCDILREGNIRAVFWVCSKGCRGRVEWFALNTSNPVAVCKVCGMTNHRHQD